MCNSSNSAAREKSYLDHLAEQRVQGILITPVDPESPTLDEVIQRGTPIVVVDRTRSRPGVCSVSVDDEHGGRLAVEHLVDRGHRRVAYLGGPTTIGQVRDRWVGPAVPGPRRVSPRPTWCSYDGRPHRRGGPSGRGAAARAADQAPARPPRSAPTTCSPSACSST